MGRGASERALAKKVRRETGRKQIRKLGKYEYLLLTEVMENPRFELIKDYAENMGVNYLTLVRVARKLALERDLLGMAFSPYRAGLDRYLVAFRLKKEYERADAMKLAATLPYKQWLKSLMISTVPMGDVYAYYLIPQGDTAEPIKRELATRKYVDTTHDIIVQRMNLTYFQRPLMKVFYKDYREWPMDLENTLKYISENDLLEPDKTELTDPYPRPPPDIIDVIIMSILEVKYIFSPKWLSTKGPFNIGFRRARYHFTRHIRDKYLLGTYIRRPLDPYADAIYIVVFRGREALPLGYTLSRTTHAYALCDVIDACHVGFWIRSYDIKLINKFLERYDIEIIKQSYREVLPEENRGQIVRSLRIGIPIVTYSMKSRRWYRLGESERRYKSNMARIERKMKKKTPYIHALIPGYLKDPSDTDILPQQA